MVPARSDRRASAALAKQSDFIVRFWGVRGSIACPGPDHGRYGGDTSCVEIRCGEHLLIFDAGTGLRRLGESLASRNALSGDLFLSHTHLDHVVGLPFFGPLYDSRTRFRLWAGHLLPDLTLREVLDQFMAAPLFPVPVEIFSGNISFHDFTAGESLEPHPGVCLRTAPLNHPNRATGYRIDYGGRSVCYVTDTEHVVGQADQNILDLIAEAEVLIYDSSYTDEEYPRFKSWGHSTWQEGVRLCDQAGVKQFVIFHHDPAHDDDFMDRVAKEAEAARPGTLVAREGMVLNP